ncbi:MAG: hypothetical protein NTZ44_01805 [Candidatus Nomurabacteria bacterium]|nr:hypothetical protein [Candidatus Nomurabacteria bacterium]
MNPVIQKTAETYKVSNAIDLGSKTQANKILKALRYEKVILSFKKRVKTDKSLAYQVEYMKEKFLDVIFKVAIRTPKEARFEIALYRNFEIMILVNENCTPKSIETFLKTEIEQRKSALLVEIEVKNMILNFIKTDKNFSKIISGVIEVTEIQDSIKGVDLFVSLVAGINVPLQIKSSEFGQQNHMKKFPSIPSICIFIYRKKKKKKISDENFKKYLLDICTSYLRGVNYLKSIPDLKKLVMEGLISLNGSNNSNDLEKIDFLNKTSRVIADARGSINLKTVAKIADLELLTDEICRFGDIVKFRTIESLTRIVWIKDFIKHL